jgi:hypothetical protein
MLGVHETGVTCIVTVIITFVVFAVAFAGAAVAVVVDVRGKLTLIVVIVLYIICRLFRILTFCYSL